jgi:hypothetical protein
MFAQSGSLLFTGVAPAGITPAGVPSGTARPRVKRYDAQAESSDPPTAAEFCAFAAFWAFDCLLAPYAAAPAPTTAAATAPHTSANRCYVHLHDASFLDV